MKLRKGDTIKITTGKDRGKSGKVLKSIPAENKILVDGLNMFKKHVKPKKQGEKGEVVLVPRPLSASNAMLICPSCGSSTRVGYIVEKDQKARACKKCKARI